MPTEPESEPESEDEAAAGKTAFKRLQEFLEEHPVTFVIITIATFLGFLTSTADSIRTLDDFVRPEPFYFSASAENPIRLSGDAVRKLIVGNSEIGKIVQPSEEMVEGRPNTWYRAKYLEDGTMIYDHADHIADREEWDWYIDDDGNLCRGARWVDFRSCRTIVSVGKNSYHATGLRTGTLRYTFIYDECQAFRSSICHHTCIVGSSTSGIQHITVDAVFTPCIASSPMVRTQTKVFVPHRKLSFVGSQLRPALPLREALGMSASQRLRAVLAIRGRSAG